MNQNSNKPQKIKSKRLNRFDIQKIVNRTEHVDPEKSKAVKAKVVGTESIDEPLQDFQFSAIDDLKQNQDTPINTTHELNLDDLDLLVTDEFDDVDFEYDWNTPETSPYYLPPVQTPKPLEDVKPSIPDADIPEPKQAPESTIQAARNGVDMSFRNCVAVALSNFNLFSSDVLRLVVIPLFIAILITKFCAAIMLEHSAFTNTIVMFTFLISSLAGGLLLSLKVCKNLDKDLHDDFALSSYSNYIFKNAEKVALSVFLKYLIPVALASLAVIIFSLIKAVYLPLLVYIAFGAMVVLRFYPLIILSSIKERNANRLN